MTPDEARTLTRKLIDAWPNGTKGYIWTELLEPLDAGTAGTAFARLLRDHEHDRTPTPQRFIGMYRSLHTEATDPTETRTCQTCHGTGGVEAPDLITADGRRYTQVDRCPDCDRPPRRPAPPLAADDPRAQAAFARGYVQGVAELDATRQRKETG